MKSTEVPTQSESGRPLRHKSKFTDVHESMESVHLKKALLLSQRDTKRLKLEVPMAPIFYPSEDEFKDPIAYIKSIRHAAESFGICKVVPPPNWKPPHIIDESSSARFSTKRQSINRLQEGIPFDDGNSYTYAQYRDMAQGFSQQWDQRHFARGEAAPSLDQLEREYWDIVETAASEVTVDYGNDIDSSKYQSGFLSRRQCQAETLRASRAASETSSTDTYRGIDTGAGADIDPVAAAPLTQTETVTPTAESPPSTTSPLSNSTIAGLPPSELSYYANCGWNLRNLPTWDGSLLKVVKTPVGGINAPWMYMGMLFSSFCWHNEDNYMNSISYLHLGKPKQWYGIPGASAGLFEQVVKEFMFESFRREPDLVYHITTQISPSVLMGADVPVYKATQDPGTFIVTFPKAYHAGFSYGFNCGEAVNFATEDWLELGAEADEIYRSYKRLPVISHQRLLFTLLSNKAQWITSDQTLALLLNQTIKALEGEIEERRAARRDDLFFSRDPIPEAGQTSFETVDKKALEYDDQRVCALCKYTGIFSTVFCNCAFSKGRVSCLRHYRQLCRCRPSSKTVVEWRSTGALFSELQAMRAALQAISGECKPEAVEA